MDTLLGSKEAARLLQISRDTLTRLIDKAQLKAHSTPGGHRRVYASELRRFALDKGLPLPAELEHASAKLRLLIVDDDELILRALRRGFRKYAHEVEATTTSSGVEALILLATRPDAMLIDLRMEGLDAFEVCRRVRAFSPLSKLKLIAMSATLPDSVAKEITRAGADVCFEKPLDLGLIVNLVRDASDARARSL